MIFKFLKTQLAARLILCLTACLIICPSANALKMWEYNGKLYDASKEKLSGTVFWSVISEHINPEYYYSGGHKIHRAPICKYIIQSMNLKTGNVKTYNMSGYLIEDDIKDRVAVISEKNGILRLYQMDKKGNCELTITVRNVQSREVHYELCGTAQAYYGGYLYLREKTDENCWTLRRINADGDQYIYQIGRYHTPVIAPSGLIACSGNDATPASVHTDLRNNSIIVEDPSNGSVTPIRVVEDGKNATVLTCIEWLDEKRILFSLRTFDAEDRFHSLHWCDISTGETGEYLTGKGSAYTDELYAKADLLEGKGLLALRKSVGKDDFYAVPAVLDLNTGKFHALYETEQTDAYSEYFLPHQRVVWMQ